MPHDNENMEELEIIEENQEENELEVAEEVQQLEQEENSEKENEDKLLSQEEVDAQIEERLNREKRKTKREMRKKDEQLERYKQIENAIRVGMSLDEKADVLEQINDFYKEQGIEIPQYKTTSNKRDDEILGGYDAQDLINSSEFEEIQNRANELAKMKVTGKISTREEAEFMALGSYLTNELKIRELKNKGIDEKVLNDSKFQEFAKKFNNDTSITEVYDMYSKINTPKVEKPASPGSVRNNATTEDKDFFTREEVQRMSKSEVHKNFEKIRKSMETWTD